MQIKVWEGLDYIIYSVCVLVTQLYPTLGDPIDYSPPASSVHGILQARILEWVAIAFSRGSSPPRERTCVSYIAGRFFTPEPPGKPMNTGVGSLSLLQGNFLTQESNWNLLYFSQILYQLSHKGK